MTEEFWKVVHNHHSAEYLEKFLKGLPKEQSFRLANICNSTYSEPVLSYALGTNFGYTKAHHLLTYGADISKALDFIIDEISIYGMRRNVFYKRLHKFSFFLMGHIPPVDESHITRALDAYNNHPFVAKPLMRDLPEKSVEDEAAAPASLTEQTSVLKPQGPCG